MDIQQLEFERERVCYEQNFEQARSLNGQMNQIPTVAITLTGGLWFAAGLTVKMQAQMRFGLLIFAALCDVGLGLAILRVRDVFHSYLEKLKVFHPPSFVEGRPTRPKMGRLGSYSMVTVYALLMFAACLLSLFGAFTFYWPFQPKMMPVGIVAAVGSLATLFVSLYSSWMRVALVAGSFAVVVALIGLWLRGF